MIYLDVNILVDVMSRRKGWKSSLRLLNDAKNDKYDFGISALTVYILHYVIGDSNPGMLESERREMIRNTINYLVLLPLDSEVSWKSLDSNFNDFEDAIQYETAKENNCSAIITRNEPDFTKSKGITIWTPEDYYEQRM